MTSQSPDMKTLQTPIRAPSAVPVDDAVLPFEVAELDLRGRLTRLGPGLDDLLAKHDYPPPVGKLLGEAVVLTTLLGSSLKFDGRFILQTQTDGPVSFLIVDFQAPDRLARRRLRDAEHCSGSCEASLPRDGNEGQEVVEIASWQGISPTLISVADNSIQHSLSSQRPVPSAHCRHRKAAALRHGAIHGSR